MAKPRAPAGMAAVTVCFVVKCLGHGCREFAVEVVWRFGACVAVEPCICQCVGALEGTATGDH